MNWWQKSMQKCTGICILKAYSRQNNLEDNFGELIRDDTLDRPRKHMAKRITWLLQISDL